MEMNSRSAHHFMEMKAIHGVSLLLLMLRSDAHNLLPMICRKCLPPGQARSSGIAGSWEGHMCALIRFWCDRKFNLQVGACTPCCHPMELPRCELTVV